MLKRKNHQALYESLVYLKDETSNILDESEKIKFQTITDDLKNNSAVLFPFTLLNEILVHFAQENSIDAYKSCIQMFNFKHEEIEKPLSILPFGQTCLSQAQWQQCETSLIRELQEDVYTQAPPEDLFKNTSTLIQNALHEIQNVSPDYFEETKALVSNVLVVHSNRFLAGSSFTLLGLIVLVDNHDPNMTAEYIIHEAAHQYLYNLMTHDELCSGEGLYTAPLRKDPRPLEGIYHAAFVLARIIDFYNKALATKTTLSKGFMEKQIDHYRLRYKGAYDLLVEKATFTDLGRDLLESSKKIAL